MREIITLQVGQCGNQIGFDFLKKLANEHGIMSDGTGAPSFDRRDVFFRQTEGYRYVPRALLFDLESKVLDNIRRQEYGSLYSIENYWASPEGGGAGNNWASGFTQAESKEDELFNLVDREAEKADNMEAFLILHSIAGGTGSGMGSFILESLNDRYRRKIIQTYSVFPTLTSDVVVQPYNSILTLKRLIQNADSVVVLDNDALNNIASKTMRLTDPSFLHLNGMISTVMAASTTTLRYPGYVCNDLVSMLAALIPTPKLHFLVTGFAPLTLSRVVNSTSNSTTSSMDTTSVSTSQTTSQSSSTTESYSLYNNTQPAKTFVDESRQPQSVSLDIMTQLLQPKNIFVTFDDQKKSGYYLSVLNVLKGPADLQLNKSLQRIRQRNIAKFVPWVPAGIQAVLSPVPSHLPPSPIEGLLLANHTSIHTLLARIVRQYDKLRKVGAFIETYRNSGNLFKQNLEEFDHSREIVMSLIEEYKAAETKEYPSLPSTNPPST